MIVKDRSSSMRVSNTVLIVLALLYWMFNILSSPFILHELSREDTSSVITVPAVVLIAVCSGLILNDRLLLLPVTVVMMYEFVVSAANLAIVIFVTYKDDISFEFPYSLIISFFEAYSTEMRNNPITTVVREVCVIIFCILTLLVAVVQISEIARKERELQKRREWREREKEVAQSIRREQFINLCRLFGFSATDNQGLSTRIALHSIAIRNRIAYSGMTASFMPLATHKRRTRHRVIPIPTVSKAKKLEERRLKSKDYVDKLILRLNIIGDKSVDIDRKKVAVGLPEFFRAVLSQKKSPRFIHRSEQKVLNFIVEEVYRIMQIERDPDVLEWLIRLEIDIIEKVVHFSDTPAMNIYAVIGILEQNPHIRVRYQALESIFTHQTFFGQGDEVDDVAQACMAVLRAFHKRKGRLVGSELPEFSMHYQKVGQWEDAEIHKCFEVLNHVIFEVTQRTISKIIRSQRVMETIFIALRLECPITERGEDFGEPSGATGLLSFLLKRSTAADWTHLRNRYRDDLRMATLKFAFDQMAWAMENDGYAAFIATDPHLLNTIWFRIFGEFDTGHDLNGEEWDVGLRLLNYGLQTNESELQRMLGMGFLLPAARYYAKNNSLSRDGTQAGIMRAVLAARPEWKQPFKKAIQGLGTTSHTARLGLTIGASRTKKANYDLMA